MGCHRQHYYRKYMTLGSTLRCINIKYIQWNGKQLLHLISESGNAELLTGKLFQAPALCFFNRFLTPPLKKKMLPSRTLHPALHIFLYGSVCVCIYICTHRTIFNIFLPPPLTILVFT